MDDPVLRAVGKVRERAQYLRRIVTPAVAQQKLCELHRPVDPADRLISRLRVHGNRTLHVAELLQPLRETLRDA
jgi:hypothetical protein